MNFVFYDLETSGRNAIWDQIIQIGAILVNENFEEVDRYESRCSLRPGLIPEPGALIVNKTTPLMLKNSNLSHFKLINEMKDVFIKWSPAIFIGYNSISFDEEFVRNALFQNLRPPYLTNTQGNQRADVLGIARSSNLYYPNCIKTPLSEKGNPVFKLDQIAPLNGIGHDDAHDAMADVEATIAIAKIVSEKIPELWKKSLITSSKNETNLLVEKSNFFCFSEFYYGKAYPYVASFICYHPKYHYPQCFDLKNDPEDFIHLTKDELKVQINKSPKFLRSIKNNKNPIIMDKTYAENFPAYEKIGFKILMERSSKIKSNPEFINKIISILTDQSDNNNLEDSQIDILAEESIYSGGFASYADKQNMEEFYNAKWEERLNLANKFSQERYVYFAKKIIYEENPSLLPKEDYNLIHRAIAQKILSTNDEKWNTIPKTYNELDNLRVKYENDNDVESLNLMNEINDLIEEIEIKYQSA